MKTRCSYAKSDNYSYYGGRGIAVCDEWKGFKAFKQWALKSGYSDSLTIDRIEGSKDYCPENCRWATVKEQNNNTSQNHILEHSGKRMNITQWSEETGINKKTIYERIRRGWSAERALTTPAIRSA